nr:phage protease [Haloferula luteola]
MATPNETGRIPLPESLVIAKWGESRDLEGRPVIVNEKTVAVLAGNQARLGKNEIALDFEHNTFRKDLPEPKPVAAYGALSVMEGVGIVWTPAADSWTPEGTKFYTGKHYRDLSPTVHRDADGVVIGLHSVALTRAGQIDDLRAYATAMSAEASPLSTDTTPTTMDTNHSAILAKLLNVSTDDLNSMKEEDIVAKFDALSKPDAPEKEETTPMNADALSARIDLLEKRNLLSEAKLAGKAIPFSAEAAEALPLSTLKTVLKDLKPGEVPTAAATSKQHGDEGRPKALSAEESEVIKQLGISEDEYRKTA